MCEGYISESVEYKKKAADAIDLAINCGSSTSSAASSSQSAIGSLIVVKQSVVKPSGSVCLRNIAPATATDSIVDSFDVIQSSVATNENERAENHETTTTNSSREQQTMITDEIEIPNSQVSTQNFMAQMDKRMVFYKCENITIQFK